jgi:hypothetical protein
MDKEKLLADLQEEFRGTQVEKVLLAYANVTPMWETAVVPQETVIKEMGELLAEATAKEGRLTSENTLLKRRLVNYPTEIITSRL